MNIYVGNLHYDTREDDLKSVFAEYGEVSSVKIITDRETGKSRGFAFVTIDDNEKGAQAIEELNGAEVNGRTLRVNEAVDKRSNDGGGRGGQQRRRRIRREYE
jgi:RNA recognition motif-containing protein